LTPHSGASDGFEVMRRRYEEAAARPLAGMAVQSGVLAGRNFSLQLTGSALTAAIGPSLSHLAGAHAGRDPNLRPGVALWDCGATAISRPDVPDGADWVASGEGWRVTSHGQGRYLCEERPASLLWLDRREAQLFGCFATAAGLGCADRARPLQRMMSELCRSLGIQEIHAGLVGTDDRGVLLVGAGGRGKTTASLDALHGGLRFLGDDSVAIGEDSANRLCGYSLYASARVRPQQLSRWPAFRGHWQYPAPPEEKALLQPHSFIPQSLACSVKIAAIAMPVVAGRGVRVERTSGLAAFHALVHESRDNRRFGLAASEFRRLARLTRTIPCFHLEVGNDPADVAAAIGSLIDREAA
jgi:hypothetical protein